MFSRKRLAPGNGHRILAGLPSKLDFTDESYWQLAGDRQKIQVLATTAEEDAPQPILWTYERGEGRVFCSILGHYSWTFDDPLFRLMLLRAIAWTPTARRPPYRAGAAGRPHYRMMQSGVKQLKRFREYRGTLTRGTAA
jgi:type 1 glutamine amidotransferase